MPSLLLGAAVVVVAIILILRSDVGAPPVVRGVMAPAFELAQLAAIDDEFGIDGSTRSEQAALVELSSFLDRVVFLNFLANRCEPC